MQIREQETREFEPHVTRVHDAPLLDDPYEEEVYRDRRAEMAGLDIAAIVVGTIMALGPLSVYSIFGS